MKLIANLYSDELKPKQERFSLNLVAGSVATVFVVMLAVALGANWYANYQQSSAQELARKSSQLQQQVVAQQRKLQLALNDVNLQNQISELETSLNQRERLLLQMRQVTETGQTSFGEILNDLARANRSSIWLHRILIADNQLTLQGHTKQAQALPQWLNSFPDYNTLKNRNFGVFELSDTQAGALKFTVGSEGHGVLMHQSQVMGVKP